MDYKETLLLPQTDFPMRGNLPQNEPARYAKWFSKESNAYARMIENRKNAPKHLFFTMALPMPMDTFILVTH